MCLGFHTQKPKTPNNNKKVSKTEMESCTTNRNPNMGRPRVAVVKKIASQVASQLQKSTQKYTEKNLHKKQSEKWETWAYYQTWNVTKKQKNTVFSE